VVIILLDGTLGNTELLCIKVLTEIELDEPYMLERMRGGSKCMAISSCNSNV